MTKFKVGDRVRVISDRTGSVFGRNADTKAGDTGTVLEESGNPWVEMDRSGHWQDVTHGFPNSKPNRGVCFSEKELELVTEEQQPKQSTMTQFKLEPGEYAKGDMDFIKMICKMADKGNVRAGDRVGKTPPSDAYAVWMCSDDYRGLINYMNGSGGIEITQGQFLLGLENLIEEKKKEVRIAGEKVDVSAHHVNVKGVRFDYDTVARVLERMKNPSKIEFTTGTFNGTNEQMFKICTLLSQWGVKYGGVYIGHDNWDNIVSMCFDCPARMVTTYEMEGDLTFEDAITNVIAAANGQSAIQVGGYVAKFGEDTVSFGCTTATLAEVEAVLNRMNQLQGK